MIITLTSYDFDLLDTVDEQIEAASIHLEELKARAIALRVTGKSNHGSLEYLVERADLLDRATRDSP